MMNQQDIFRKIGNILTELNEQYEFLAKNAENLNELEMELFLANADFLSDHVRIAQKLNNTLAPHPHNAETDTSFLLKEQNTIVLPEVMPSFANENAPEPSVLEEIATAEEEEQRVDIVPEEELIEDEIIQEEISEKVLEKDFFKPDQDDHTFEFVLNNHSADDKFDFEEKSVDEIFDRPLSKAEEEILAQKKRIHDKELEPLNESSEPENDEIGPEPFLIPHEEELKQEPQTLFTRAESKPVEEVKTAMFDEPIISPPVEERPAFVPQAVPVKPIEEPIATKPTPSLNDLLAKTNGQKETAKAPIADLKQAINLNEKLLFIKDLFSGYNMAYSEAIDIINRMTSFEAADSFLQNNYAAKNNWAGKQNTVDQFYELLNRRFSK